MGIRVHKVVGYGITDLAYESGKHGYKRMTDPRVDWERLRERSEEMYDTDGDGFVAWMETNWEAILKLEAEERRMPLEKVRKFPLTYVPLMREYFGRHKHWDLGHCVVHDTEGGLPEVMVLIPPTQGHDEGYGGWRRYDDTIDWVEETHIYGSKSRVVQLPCCGIYPHDHLMVRFRDPKLGLWESQPNAKGWPSEGRKSDADGLPVVLGAQDYNWLVGRWDPRKVNPVAEGELLEHLLKDWRPELPGELLALMLWMGDCFPDMAAIRDSLRPVLYVYWS